MTLVVPGRPPKGTRCLCHPAMCKQRHQREQTQQRRGGPSYGQIRPLPLRLEPEMPSHLLESYLQLPQRITNRETIFFGSALRSVRRKAWVLNSSCGSRTNTQRKGTANKPVLYHTAVAEATSTMRSSLPYQLAIMVGFQTVFGSSATTERLGRRSPLRRGLPI